MAIQDIEDYITDGPENRVSATVHRKDDTRTLETERPECFKKLFVKMEIISQVNLAQEVVGKPLKGYSNLYQVRVGDSRSYYFRYNKRENRAVFVNWCDKKKKKTDTKVLERAEKLKQEAWTILDGETS